VSWTDDVQSWWPTIKTPLRIRAFLKSPMAHDSCRGMSGLEGALQTVVVEQETGRNSFEAITELGTFFDIPIPIADVDMHGFKIAQCSHAQWPEHAIEDKRARRKRTDLEAIGRDKIMTAGGAFKALDLEVPTLIASWIDFYVVGDPVKLRELLPCVGGFGREWRRGFGAVESFEISDSEDWSLVRDCRPMRNLPVESEHEAGILYDPSSCDVRMETTRAPYWHRRSRALCACPVPR